LYYAFVRAYAAANFSLPEKIFGDNHAKLPGRQVPQMEAGGVISSPVSKNIPTVSWVSARPSKKRTKRKGSHAAETTPVAKARNRRGKNSLRSDSLPLHPAPDLAARPSDDGATHPEYPQPNQEALMREIPFFGWIIPSV